MSNTASLIPLYPVKRTGRPPEVNAVLLHYQYLLTKYRLPAEVALPNNIDAGGWNTFDPCGDCDHAATVVDDMEDGACVDCNKPQKSKASVILGILQMTGGTESMAWDLVVEHKKKLKAIGLSLQIVLLFSHPYLNSLPAALETAAYIRKNGISCRICHFPDKYFARIENNRDVPEFSTEVPNEAPADVTKVMNAVTVRNSLNGQRLGVIGAPSDWLLSCKSYATRHCDCDCCTGSAPLSTVDDVNPATVLRQTGINIVPVHLKDLSDGYMNAAKSKPSLSDVEAAELMDAELRSVIKKNDLNAVTVRCFDLLPLNVTCCLSLSKLNDEMITAGCEGDIHAAITMMLLSQITRRPTFMANPIDYDVATNSLLIAHCTIARDLCSSDVLRTHFESGKSVAVQGILNEGLSDVWTLARYDVGTGLLFCEPCRVDAVKQPVEYRCRTQVNVHFLNKGACEKLAYAAVGNHHILVPGDACDVMRDFVELFCK